MFLNTMANGAVGNRWFRKFSLSKHLWASYSSACVAPHMTHFKTTSPYIELNDALQLFDKIRESNTPYITSHCVTMLSAIVRAKRYTVAIDFYRNLASNGVFGNISVLNILVNCYCAVSCTGYGFGVLGIVVKRGFDLKRVCFVYLVKGLCVQNMIGEAVSLLFKLNELDICPGVNTYRAILKGLCETGVSDIAVSLNEKMATANDIFGNNFHRDLISYNIIIDGLFRDGMIDKARDLFTEAKIKGIYLDVVTYGSMIHGLVGAAKWEEASCLFFEMKKCGVFPDVVVYNSVIHGLCRSGDWQNARIVFCEMIELGIKPSVVTYNILIKALFKAHKSERATGLLELMIQRGETPDRTTFNTLMHGFCASGEINSVRDVFVSMTKSGVEHDVVSYSVLINAYCDHGVLVKALRLYIRMIQMGIQPTVVTLNTLLNGLFLKGMVREAECLIKERNFHCLTPNEVTYNIMIDRLCTSDSVEDELKLRSIFKSGDLRLNIQICNHIIERLFETGKLRVAESFFNNLHEEGILPTVDTYSRMITGLCKGGKIGGARQLILDMDSKGISISTIAFDKILDNFCQINDTRSVVELLKMLLERQVYPSRTTISVALNLLSKDQRDPECFSLIRSFQSMA